MKVFAISDLHLSGMADKPMNVFGGGWEGHFEKIKQDWEEKVSEEDIVLLGGDTSWGMKLEEGIFDVRSLACLKGHKILIRGNHDYWWNGISRVRALRPDDSFVFLQNDCVKIGNLIVAGSRGWTCPGSNDFTEHDKALYLREAERFRLAFKQVEKVRCEGDELIALIHYPPFNIKREDTLFTQLFEENRVNKAVFGHLHGSGYFPLRSEKNSIEYFLTSCDKIHFRLTQIY
ncbi:MAG: serine/threonine protein phosphatase [Clostridia bacterium]|jgi:predicted phosphohydrolase|nr:serine/threonine protein phosphatase [Clostridia bacterium]